MLGFVHDMEGTDEYVTLEQIKEQLTPGQFIVTGYFAAANSENGANGEKTVAKVLYKGDSEANAKAVWIHDEKFTSNPTICNYLFCEHGFFSGAFRTCLDLDEAVIRNGVETSRINYPISIFDSPDEALGEFVYIKMLKQSGENAWYVIRVYDIDIIARSFVGQVVHKDAKRDVAIDVWDKAAEENGGKHYYIFNPSHENVPN